MPPGSSWASPPAPTPPATSWTPKPWRPQRTSLSTYPRTDRQSTGSCNHHLAPILHTLLFRRGMLARGLAANLTIVELGWRLMLYILRLRPATHNLRPPLVRGVDRMHPRPEFLYRTFPPQREGRCPTRSSKGAGSGAEDGFLALSLHEHCHVRGVRRQ